MPKITLVCSAHRENGFCNAGELLKILRAIGPETIFEEIRPSDFDAYRKHRPRSSLEAQAIAKYLELKSLRRVPVDRYDMPETLLAESKSEFDCVFDYVEQTSREYQLLTDENDKGARQFGFGYLNGADFATVRKRLCEIEDKTIKESGDLGLIRGLESWRHRIQRREREMIGVIYEYCRENVFDTGLFLVGAAHKTGIVKEIEKYASTEADLINWDFADDRKVHVWVI